MIAQRSQDCAGVLVGQHSDHDMDRRLVGQVARNCDAGVRIVAPVEPDGAMACQHRQRAGTKLLQACRPLRGDDAARHGIGRYRHDVLMAQHGHGKRSIVRLMRAGQVRQRQVDRPV